jgi:hypothetical protein
MATTTTIYTTIQDKEHAFMGSGWTTAALPPAIDSYTYFPQTELVSDLVVSLSN